MKVKSYIFLHACALLGKILFIILSIPLNIYGCYTWLTTYGPSLWMFPVLMIAMILLDEGVDTAYALVKFQNRGISFHEPSWIHSYFYSGAIIFGLMMYLLNSPPWVIGFSLIVYYYFSILLKEKCFDPYWKKHVHSYYQWTKKTP